MKAIVENPLNVDCSPIAISLYVNMLNKITQCEDKITLRETMNLVSMNYPATFDSIFDYGFGSNHMWVSEKESGKRLILVEF